MATKQSVILLVRKPGSIAKICSNASGSGIYASSPDGRFVVWAYRRMTGDRGRRSYHYSFDAVDRGIPSGGRSYTEIPQLPNERSSAEKTLKAVARYIE